MSSTNVGSFSRRRSRTQQLSAPSQIWLVRCFAPDRFPATPQGRTGGHHWLLHLPSGYKTRQLGSEPCSRLLKRRITGPYVITQHRTNTCNTSSRKHTRCTPTSYSLILHCAAAAWMYNTHVVTPNTRGTGSGANAGCDRAEEMSHSRVSSRSGQGTIVLRALLLLGGLYWHVHGSKVLRPRVAVHWHSFGPDPLPLPPFYDVPLFQRRRPRLSPCLTRLC